MEVTHVKVGGVLKTQCAATENPRFSGNAIWEKAERQKQEDKVGTSESLRQILAGILRCRNERI